VVVRGPETSPNAAPLPVWTDVPRNTVVAKPVEAPAAARAIPVTNPAKSTALRLLAESRQLQKEGRLVEARQKALDAQQTGAVFATEEDRPELALLATSALAEKRVEGLVRQSSSTAAN